MNENLKYINETLSDKEIKSLDRYVSESEILKSLKDMKNNKSPGEDGLTKEFYLHFFDDLKGLLCEVINTSLIRAELPQSQKNALIRLLYKKSDHRLLKNWRPVSLLTTDYKILSKILTTRLSPYMEKLVPTEQKCGVKGRQIPDLIRNLDLICEDMEKTGGFLVCLDQEKAFDRVNHEYMYKIIEKLGITGKFLNAIRAMYTGITSQILVNGTKTDKVQIKRGIRQGCCFSMLIFILVSIPLINMLKDDKLLKGYKTKWNRPLHVQAYADDTTVLITEPRQYKKIIDIYEKHARASEAKINREKTEILKLGNVKQGDVEFQNKIKCKMKILGTFFTSDRSKIGKVNMDYILKSAGNIFTNNYLKYGNEILGKTLIVNTLVYSKMNHLMWILRDCNTEISQLIRQVTDFIIPECQDSMNISKKQEEGGTGLINLKRRIISAKLKSIINTTKNEPENDNIKYFSSTKGRNVYGNTGKPTIEKTPQIYDEVFNIFYKYAGELSKIKKPKSADIERIIFPPEKKWPYGRILDPRVPKESASSYKIIKDLVGWRPDLECFLCGQSRDNMMHVLINCKKTTKIIKLCYNYIKVIEESFDWNYINVIYMQNVKSKETRYLIQLYKYIILQWRICKIKKSNIEIEKIINMFNKRLDFYLTYINP